MNRYSNFAGDAPKEAAPVAADASIKGEGVQSVADPANVEQALDSVGDAVENAVPDPKGAEPGLAPTAASDSPPASQPVSNSNEGESCSALPRNHEAAVRLPVHNAWQCLALAFSACLALMCVSLDAMGMHRGPVRCLFCFFQKCSTGLSSCPPVPY